MHVDYRRQFSGEPAPGRSAHRSSAANPGKRRPAGAASWGHGGGGAGAGAGGDTGRWVTEEGGGKVCTQNWHGTSTDCPGGGTNSTAPGRSS